MDWDQDIRSLPGAHFLQTEAWAQVKAGVGWAPDHRRWEKAGKLQAAALVLRRSFRFGRRVLPFSILYAPKAPLLDWSDEALRCQVLDDLQALARQSGAIFIKIDPDVTLGHGAPGQPGSRDEPLGAGVSDDLRRRGWRFSADQIQFRNTVIVNLEASEAALLARMKQKMRYNIRLAERKGVRVCAGTESDLALLYHMYAETAVRDDFVIRDESYYRSVWGRFMRAGMAEPLIAEVDGEPVAGVVIYRYAGQAWYVYGMSREAHREKMPNALLQWEAMRRAKEAGCHTYDLWGAPDEFVETDPLWKVYRFKEGFGGEVIRTLGAWDYIARPQLHTLYTNTLPRLLDAMRRRGRARTKRQLGV